MPIPQAATAYRRGYSNPVALREEITRAHATSFWRTSATAVIDNLVLLLVVWAAGSPAARSRGLTVFGAVLVMAAVIAARQLRALECLVHEASHFNWSRRHRRAADLLATVLAAGPTGSGLSGYRESHLIHHGRFGTAQDPDRIRYGRLGLEDLDRRSLHGYVSGLAKRLGPYQLGWLRTLGSGSAAACMPLVWEIALVTLPAYLLGGLVWAGVSSATWLLSYIVVLPALRFVAESGEHIYQGTDTVVAATISNIGLLHRILIHPHGDGYHTVHHLWPGIPHHRLAGVHRLLIANDAQYRDGLRYRTRVLEYPRTGVREGLSAEAGYL